MEGQSNGPAVAHVLVGRLVNFLAWHSLAVAKFVPISRNLQLSRAISVLLFLALKVTYLSYDFVQQLSSAILNFIY